MASYAWQSPYNQGTGSEQASVSCGGGTTTGGDTTGGDTTGGDTTGGDTTGGDTTGGDTTGGDTTGGDTTGGDTTGGDTTGGDTTGGDTTTGGTTGTGRRDRRHDRRHGRAGRGASVHRASDLGPAPPGRRSARRRSVPPPPQAGRALLASSNDLRRGGLRPPRRVSAPSIEGRGPVPSAGFGDRSCGFGPRTLVFRGAGATERIREASLSALRQLGGEGATRKVKGERDEATHRSGRGHAGRDGAVRDTCSVERIGRRSVPGSRCEHVERRREGLRRGVPGAVGNRAPRGRQG